jgi:diaminohydroxyphosphoribosylaminopyrimidine deaminase / 5-amino-6-(5-phosphoribosylamino)uracil reductase
MSDKAGPLAKFPALMPRNQVSFRVDIGGWNSVCPEWSRQANDMAGTRGISGSEKACRRMLDCDDAWQALLDIGAACEAPCGEIGLPDATLVREEDGGWRLEPPAPPEIAALFAIYTPFCAVPPGRTMVVAHLGQSLDGRIATLSGASRWVTGAADIAHNHRMRALADAVLIGAATLRSDDPQLTVRRCAGGNPVRVVLDTNRALGGEYRVFRDGAAPTLLICARDRCGPGERLGAAEIVGLPRDGDGLAPDAIVAELTSRGLRRVFVEGGGITVSRFLAAGCLDRLQITISPLIIGSGRPSITLPAIDDLRNGIRPRVRRFDLGEDVMFECMLRD